MRPRCTVLLIPFSLNSTLFHQIANPCICHTSKESPAKSSACHTSKNRSRKSFPCHTYEPPHPGSLLLCGPLNTDHRLRSSRRSLSATITNLQLYFQSLPRCPSGNPFLFTLLHCCPGGYGDRKISPLPERRRCRPERAVLRENLNEKGRAEAWPLQQTGSRSRG